MPRKKRKTYEELSRTVQDLQEQMDAEKQRITTAMSSCFVISPEDAYALSGFRDSDLRKVMSLLSVQLGACIQQVKHEKAISAGSTASAPADNQMNRGD